MSSSSKSDIHERLIDGNIIEVCEVNEFQAMDWNEHEHVHVIAGEDEFHGSRSKEYHQSNNMENVPDNMIINNDMSMICPTQDDIRDLINCSIVGSSFELQSSLNRPYLLPWQVNSPQITVPENSELICEGKLYDSLMESVCVISDRSISDGWGNIKSRHEFSNSGVRSCVPDDSRTSYFDFSNTKYTVIDGDVMTSSREHGNLNHVKRNKATIRHDFVRRPRDRQMIQDHLKVLRDIVPGGYKCSIDHLLHRSIQHMLFLRMASERDEKLMNYLDNEVMVKNESRGFHAYSKIGHFPVVLEDLQYPGHLFIQIFCEEEGMFLDISRVICGLGLTIVKGWMEKRRDNRHAGFIIKVGDKLIHKMEILYPLLQLVQNKGISAATNMYV